jgi:toxin ParE1/3/4
MMAFEVILLPAAEVDLEEIRLQLEPFSLTAFERLVLAIQKRFRTLSIFPEAGRSCEDLAPNLRVIFVNGFAIFYRVSESKVTVARIVDGRRNLPEIWNETT